MLLINLILYGASEFDGQFINFEYEKMLLIGADALGLR